MPRKVRKLLQELKAAGFSEIAGGKGSHRKLGPSSISGCGDIERAIG